MSKIKAVLYSRYSPRPDKECASCEKQLEDCREYCDGKDYEIVGEYRDEAVSGGDLDRDGIDNAINDLRRGYRLVVRSADRLARGNQVAEALLLKIASKGAYFETCDGIGTFEESPEQAMLRGMLQVFAEYQRRSIKRMTSKRMRQYSSNGRLMSKRPPYGFVEVEPEIETVIRDGVQVRRKRRRFEPEHDQQQIIQRIRNLHDQGLRERAIARALNEQGITCRGGQWYHSTVRKILQRARA